MWKWIYQRLPIIREQQGQRLAMHELRKDLIQRFRLLDTAAYLQAIQTLRESDPRYCDPARLLTHGAQYWSQNLEDGMIAEIFRRIGTGARTFLEIGVGDGSENNTTNLLAQGWSGWWLDGDGQCCESIRARLREMPSLASRLQIRQALVAPENIATILKEAGVPQEIDLFSLDIDLNTYHIWQALEHFRPRVVVVEYNAAIPPDVTWIHPYHADKVWDYSQAFGASLKAYELLGRSRGYSLAGCDMVGINAFFVRSDLIGDKFAAPFTAENHYEPPRYGLSFRLGHRSAFFGESAPLPQSNP